MKTLSKKEDSSKTRILEAATKLFAQKGFEGTSIREICKLANANVCMISYYWGGKNELYQGIIDNLIERQIEFAKNFIDFEQDTSKLNKSKQIDLLFLSLERFIEFFYTQVSKDLLTILLKEQQNEHFVCKSPALLFLRKLVANIFEKDELDREIIFKTLFIISQVNSPRIMNAFSLRLLGQDDFIEEDIKIIKNNVKSYAKMLIKEAGIV